MTAHDAPPLFRSRLFTLWILFFVLGILGLAFYSDRILERLVTDSLVSSARTQAQFFKNFRSLYTSEVMERIRAHPEIDATHDYKERDMAIPLPATLTIEMAELMGQDGDGNRALLYSPWPFPWREATGGLRDSFQEEAWANLPEEDPYYRIADYEGSPALRYATADIMRAECVQCHNNHLNTPRKGWVEGDMRGVLEIVSPIVGFESWASPRRRTIAVLTGAVLAYGLVVIGILLLHNWRNQSRLSNELQSRTEENRKMQQRLFATERLSSLGEITSGLAHELNQPLGTMKLSCSLMLTAIEEKQPEKSVRVLNRITRQVDRIDALIRKFNSFVRQSSRSKLEETDLDSILHQAVQETIELSERAGVSVELAIDPGLPLIFADPVELEIVARNLITNALQATEGRTEPIVSLKVGHDTETVYFEVSDNGTGIPPELQSRIFEPFFTTKRVDKGTGLGLSLCRGVMERHRGKIELQSSGSGGTSFRVTIPRVITP